VYLQVDLKKLGISSYGELESGQLGDCANDKLELFFPTRVRVNAAIPVHTIIHATIYLAGNGPSQVPQHISSGGVAIHAGWQSAECNQLPVQRQ